MNKRINVILSITMILILSIPINIYISNNLLEVNEYMLGSDKLPKEFNGFTILHMTDNHIKTSEDIELHKRFIMQSEKRLLEQHKKIDCIFVTGDLIDCGDKMMEEATLFMKELTQKYDVYFVAGNHDYNPYFGKLLKSNNVKVLCNESVELKRGKASIYITGIQDSIVKLNNEDLAYKALPMNVFNITITHSPNIFDKISSYGADVVLCGHTHAGQIRFPFLPVLYVPGQGFLPKYGYGLYNKKKEGRNTSVMYVNKGIGYTKPIQFRFFNRPEIAIFTLAKNNN